MVAPTTRGLEYTWQEPIDCTAVTRYISFGNTVDATMLKFPKESAVVVPSNIVQSS
jgi:hypothetical protein